MSSKFQKNHNTNNKVTKYAHFPFGDKHQILFVMPLITNILKYYKLFIPFTFCRGFETKYAWIKILKSLLEKKLDQAYNIRNAQIKDWPSL